MMLFIPLSLLPSRVPHLKILYEDFQEYFALATTLTEVVATMPPLDFVNR